jgi:hypothetical protein
VLSNQTPELAAAHEPVTIDGGRQKCSKRFVSGLGELSGYSVDCWDELSRGSDLCDVACGVNLRNLPANDCGIVLADDYDFGLRKLSAKDPRRLETVHSRHRHVHQDDVWTKRLGLLDGFESIGCFAADSPVRARRQQCAKASSRGFVIVDNQDSEQAKRP